MSFINEVLRLQRKSLTVWAVSSMAEIDRALQPPDQPFDLGWRNSRPMGSAHHWACHGIWWGQKVPREHLSIFCLKNHSHILKDFNVGFRL